MFRRTVSRRWPEVFLSDNHITTFYGHQRVILNARVHEDVQDDKKVFLRWNLPKEKKLLEAHGEGKSRKAARIEARRKILKQLTEPTETAKMIANWRAILHTTKLQLDADVTLDAAQRPGEHDITWLLYETKKISVIGRGPSKELAELDALQKISTAAEEARTDIKAPTEVKASKAAKAAWDSEKLSPSLRDYYLQQLRNVSDTKNMQTTESTLPYNDGGYCCTLEWRFFESDKPTKSFLTTGIATSKQMAKAVAAKKMLEERGFVGTFTGDDMKLAEATKAMCLREEFDIKLANNAMKTLRPEQQPTFLLDVWNKAILLDITDQLILPKSTTVALWKVMLDKASFQIERDALKGLRDMEIVDTFDSDVAKKYFMKFRYLLASERRAKIRSLIEGRTAELEQDEVRWMNSEVLYQSRPYVTLNLPKEAVNHLGESIMGEGDIIAIRPLNEQERTKSPLLAKVTSGKKGRVTAQLMHTPKIDFTKVQIFNLEGEIPALRQIEALEDFVRPENKTEAVARKESRFSFDPELRDALLNLESEPEKTKGRLELVHGPPGTGKTYTACQIVLQWLEEAERNIGILCVTDSNAAADNLYNALKKVGVKVFRFQKDPGPDCESSKSYRSWSEEPHNYFLKSKVWAEMIEHHPVVVSTCSSAGHPAFDKFVFDALILDEATQTTEPSLLVALGRGVKQTVLIGDNKQLPPTIFETPELKTTLFDRLDRVLSEDDKLFIDEQRRMAPEIMAFPSKQFYNNRLISKVEREIPVGWPGKTRVLFREINGEEEVLRGSKFNKREAKAVKEEVKRLFNVNPMADIAVITPYVAQENVLKRELVAFPQVRIDTIDGFQGNEADIVLFSTVRSESIGFLGDPQRANVALTRARSGLQLFGRVHCLSKNNLWREWLIFHRIGQ